MPYKHLLLVLFMIALLKAVQSQNTIYSELYNHNTGVTSDNPSPGRTISCFDSGTLYSVAARASIGSDAIKVFAFDTSTKKSQIHKITRTKDLKKLFNEQIESIAHLKNKLVIIAFDCIYIFKEDGNHGYRLTKTIKNEGSFLNLYQLNDQTLLCYVNYQYHPLDEDHMHTWAKLDVESDSLSMEYYFGNENVRFSSIPNQWISAYKGLIAYSHTTDYKVVFYDVDFNITDSITSDALQSNTEKLRYIPDGTDYSLEEMKKISAADDTLLTRIEKIFLLDSTSLLIIQKQPHTHYMKYDLWKKTKGKWNLTKTQSLPGHYENGASYDRSNNYVIGFYGNYSGLSYAGNGEFYVVYFPFTENPISKTFDYQKDYYDKVNDLTVKKQLFYGIRKLKIITN